MFRTYDEENAILAKQYRENNYIVRYNEGGKNGLCYVYFSGNGLYERDNQESFMHQVVDKDRYEWLYYSAACKPEKEIFIRDIWLSWYVKGVNQHLSTFDTVVKWLSEECQGYRVTMVGNSAGGFMAVSCASYMTDIVERVFSFCGQFSLNNHNDHVKTNPLLVRYGHMDYFECHKKMGCLNRLYYFYSGGVEHDCIQAEFAGQEACVRSFCFESSRHGVTVNNFDYPFLISMTNEQLDGLYSKMGGCRLTADTFSKMLYGKYKLWFQKIKQKVKRKYMGFRRKVGL